ncbi:hypothetical protein M9458_016444, partial [Cirrhinus mrigala]
GVTAVAPHAVMEKRDVALKAYLAVRRAVAYVTINLPVGAGLILALAAAANQITLPRLSHAQRTHQRSHHRVPPAHLAPYPPGIPIPYNPMMVMMVPQHPHPHLALGAPHPQTPTLPPHPGLPPSGTPGGPPGAPPTRDLGSVPPELTASRQSFHLAMGNP